MRYKKKTVIKSFNNKPIRVLYKQAGKTPVVRIIKNPLVLKKAIINRNLEIIPYENLFIICNNKKIMSSMALNIFLSLFSIRGDFILIRINRKTRQFESLSQEDILWYSKALMNRSFDVNDDLGDDDDE